ncbi:hypothetical protein HOG17_05235 [Candidatus Peregrinibacteria bacterium]|jgi:hypothetical protein|nr:hypothetical protein [Candidatus Peregrinibacteria bacterium]MBT4148194.1 hypothetical protein [Candidatus Peregrinibacteria bacterium]MBT4455668.1 hypothetical protein [Candidatus Peregrinibacteria bacterium]
MADEAMTPKSGGFTKILGLLVVLALIVGAALYYGGFLGGSDDDMPPSLDLTGETGQGMLALDGDAYATVVKDDPDYDCDATTPIDVDVPTGSGTAVFVYPTEDVTFEDLTTYVQAEDEDAKVMFVYWNEAGDGTPYEERYTLEGERSKNWYAYPGVTSLTKIPVADLDDYEIEAYHGFYMVVFDADVEVCPDKLALQDEGLDIDSVADGVDFYEDYVEDKIPDEGWVLLAANDEDVLKTILEESTATDSTFTVDSAWIQMDDDPDDMFTGGKVDLEAFYNDEETLSTDYDMMWLKVTEYDEDKVYLTDYLDVVSVFAEVSTPTQVTVTFNEDVKTINSIGTDFGVVKEGAVAETLTVTNAKFGPDVLYPTDPTKFNYKEVVLTLAETLTVLTEGNYKLTSSSSLESKDDGYPLDPNDVTQPFNLSDYLNLVEAPAFTATSVILTFDQDLVAVDEDNFEFNKVETDADGVVTLVDLADDIIADAKFVTDADLTVNKKVVELTLSIPVDPPAGMTYRLTMIGLATADGTTFVVGGNHVDFVSGGDPVVEDDYLDLMTATSADGVTITLTFDEDLKPEEAADSAKYVVTDAAAVEYTVGLAAMVATDPKQVTLTMDPVLLESGTYTVTVSNLLGLDGSTLDPVDPTKSVATFEFAAPVAATLELVSAAAVDDGAGFQLTFNEGVNPAGLTLATIEDNILVEPSVTMTSIISNGAGLVSVGALLTADVPYTVTVSNMTAAAGGGGLVTDKNIQTFTYTEQVVATLELVTAAALVDGMGFTLTFNEALDPLTATAANISVNVLVIDEPTLSDNNKILTVPVAAEMLDGEYTVDVTGMTNAAGVGFAEDMNTKTFTYTAEPLVTFAIGEVQPDGFSPQVLTMALDVLFLGVESVATGGTVELSAVRLNLVSGDVADLSNIRVVTSGEPVGSAAASFNADKTVVFTFDPVITILEDTSLVFFVKADLTADAVTGDSLEINLTNASVPEGVQKTIGMDIPLVVTVQ